MLDRNKFCINSVFFFFMKRLHLPFFSLLPRHTSRPPPVRSGLRLWWLFGARKSITIARARVYIACTSPTRQFSGPTTRVPQRLHPEIQFSPTFDSQFWRSQKHYNDAFDFPSISRTFKYIKATLRLVAPTRLFFFQLSLSFFFFFYFKTIIHIRLKVSSK